MLNDMLLTWTLSAPWVRGRIRRAPRGLDLGMCRRVAGPFGPDHAQFGIVTCLDGERLILDWREAKGLDQTERLRLVIAHRWLQPKFSSIIGSIT